MPAVPLRDVQDIESKITTFSTTLTFPESLDAARARYEDSIQEFARLVQPSASTEDLLRKIRSQFRGKPLMSQLKLFRRCVSPAADTERTKKVSVVSTTSLIQTLGDTFKGIEILKAQFKSPLDQQKVAALSVLLGENDFRGQSGYALTAAFFDWFESRAAFTGLTAKGPRGAGSDIQLKQIIPDFDDNYPCDIVIQKESGELMAVGFARYDATRGGSQSDDRTGGNANKVDKARAYFSNGGKKFRLLFLSDGPGLLHGDTLREACSLDGNLEGLVRVTTLKLAPDRVTYDWLVGADP